MKSFLFCLLLIGSAFFGWSQTSDGPYHINGNAAKENCNCYTLTPNATFNSGSVWNINKISLAHSFDYKFEVFLGCTDANGADGIAFVLQPISTSVGSVGGGIGFEGVKPSIGVVIDTWQNQENNDPAYDHISINRDGDLSHNNANNLAGPVTALDGNNNIEDCQWHALRVTWDAGAHKLSAYMDGKLRVSATLDLVASVFGGDPEVFWGFSAATGGSMNHQRFCTSLNAGFSQLPEATYCAPAVLDFKDESRSFGDILQWYWDFGDGTTSTLADPPPHAYPAPGNYTVKNTILGNNGCWSDTFKQVITIGSIPVSAFTPPAEVCEGSPVALKDISTVAYGTINKWSWTINGQPYEGQAPPAFPAAGNNNQVSLQVSTKEGCIGNIAIKSFATLPRPKIELAADEAICLGAATRLQASSVNPASEVVHWNWTPAPAADQPFLDFTGASFGNQLFTVSGSAANGCNSDTLEATIEVIGTKADAGRDTVVADNQPVQLNGSGGPILQWSPAEGLDNPLSPNPIATITRETTYVLTASTDYGCKTTDTLHIRVYKGPELYMPNSFTPNNDRRNDRFRFIAVGMQKMNYFRIYNRLGQQVYNSLDPAGWDGRFQGKDQPSGVYAWMISGVDYNGKEYVKKGSLLLLR